MAATIKIKNSSTASAVPTSSDLVQGELAVNVTDKRLFTENASGTVVELGTNPTILTLPDGSASAPTLTNDGDTNTGIFFPAADTVAVTTGGTERARVDSSGNLGLAATPTNNTLGKTLQVGQAGAWVAESGSNRWWLANNWYYNSGDKYINNGYATLYSQQNGTHQWQIAASGTAGGTVSFTQAMTLDASGRLGLGVTSPTLSFEVGINAAKGYMHSGVGVFSVGTSTNHAYGFDINGTERARIDSSGNLLVGQTSTGAQNLNSFAIQVSTASIVQNHINGTGSGSGYTSFAYNAGVIGSITQNGTTAVAYNTTSDYRLKENVQPLSGALARVAAMKPCTYTWKSAPDEIGEGFIAHELQEVCPQAVTGEKDAVNEDGSIKPQSIDTSFLVATLTAAIQELKAEFDAYKASHP